MRKKVEKIVEILFCNIFYEVHDISMSCINIDEIDASVYLVNQTFLSDVKLRNYK